MNWRDIPIKDRSKTYKDISIDMTIKEKINLMKGMYEGEQVFLVGCGSSLCDFTQEELESKIGHMPILTIKQAYSKLENVADIHHLNCNNLSIYDTRRTIVVASAARKDLTQMRGGLFKNLDIDIYFKILTSKGSSVCQLKNWEDNTYENRYQSRPWGPGTLFETAIFTAVHVGATKISSIGVDLSPLNWNEHKDGVYLSHFYDQETKYKPLDSPRGCLFVGESKIVLEGTKSMYNWLKSKGIEWTIANKNSHVHEDIPRDLWMYEQ